MEFGIHTELKILRAMLMRVRIPPSAPQLFFLKGEKMSYSTGEKESIERSEEYRDAIRKEEHRHVSEHKMLKAKVQDLETQIEALKATIEVLLEGVK